VQRGAAARAIGHAMRCVAAAAPAPGARAQARAAMACRWRAGSGAPGQMAGASRLVTGAVCARCPPGIQPCSHHPAPVFRPRARVERALRLAAAPITRTWPVQGAPAAARAHLTPRDPPSVH
jgi:hypothetical protein